MWEVYGLVMAHTMGCIVDSRSFDNDDDAPHQKFVALLRRPPNILSACVWFQEADTSVG